MCTKETQVNWITTGGTLHVLSAGSDSRKKRWSAYGALTGSR